MTREKYIKAQTAFIELTGLCKGTKVKVLRKAKNDELGWDNSWTESMSGSIGQTLTVRDALACNEKGIMCDDGFRYPFFCLEVVVDTLPKIPLNSSAEYSAEIQEDGSIKVGCQTISFETLEKIYTEAKKVIN